MSGGFFFSSRRRHTRYWRDWSSDVCSSDLGHLHQLVDRGGEPLPVARLERRDERQARVDLGRRARPPRQRLQLLADRAADRKSVVLGKSVDLGGRRIIKNKNHRTLRYFDT